MELRQLRYFMALAEEGSFTRAAERLHITQPPLSQQIKLLEGQLGVRLFVRGPRGVVLTDPGRTLLTHARALTEGAKAAAREITQVAAGTVGDLRLGVINSALFTILPAVLQRLRKDFPGVGVSIAEMGSHAQLRAIMLGNLDLGVVHLAQPAAGLQIDRLVTEPVCVALHERHRLAGRRKLSLASLHAEDFVFSLREVAPVSFDHMIAICVRAGFSPRIRHTSVHLTSTIQMVSLGLGVALVPRSLSRREVKGVKFVPLNDPLAAIDIFVVTRADHASQLLRNVRDAVLKIRPQASASALR